MTPKTWKAVELKVARLYGAHRISLSGSNNHQGRTSSDTDHPALYVEVKHGKRLLPFGGLWKVVRAAAKAEGKVPVIVLHPLRGEALAVISAERHAALEELLQLRREQQEKGSCSAQAVDRVLARLGVATTVDWESEA